MVVVHILHAFNTVEDENLLFNISRSCIEAHPLATADFYGLNLIRRRLNSHFHKIIAVGHESIAQVHGEIVAEASLVHSLHIDVERRHIALVKGLDRIFGERYRGHEVVG